MPCSFAQLMEVWGVLNLTSTWYNTVFVARAHGKAHLCNGRNDDSILTFHSPLWQCSVKIMPWICSFNTCNWSRVDNRICFFILNEEEADTVEGHRGKPCLQGWWCSIITEGFAVSKCHWHKRHISFCPDHRNSFLKKLLFKYMRGRGIFIFSSISWSSKVILVEMIYFSARRG